MRSCAATADRCARSQFRRTARPRYPAASMRRRFAGRSLAAAAEQVLRFHESAVNAVAVAAGWPPRHRRRGRPHRDLEAGRGATRGRIRRPHRAGRRARGVAGRCDASPRRRGIARSGSGRSAAAHARARGPSAERQRRRLHARRQVAGQRRLRLTVRIWPLDGGAPTIVTLPSPLNAVAVAPRRRDRRRRRRRQASISCSPAGESRGEVDCRPKRRSSRRVLRRRRARCRRRHPRLGRDHRARTRQACSARWSGLACRYGRSAFLPDNRTLLTGGTDRMVRRWDAMTGDHIGAVPVSGAGRSAGGLRRRSRRARSIAPASPATR